GAGRNGVRRLASGGRRFARRCSVWASAVSVPSTGSRVRTQRTRGKKRARPPDSPGAHPTRLGPGVRGRGVVESPGAPGPAQLGGGGPAPAVGRADGREGRPGSQSAGLLRLVGT